MGGTVETNFMVSQAWTFPLETANDEKKAGTEARQSKLLGQFAKPKKNRK